MKAADLKFPMIVFWKSSATTYAVQENNGKLNYTSLGRSGSYFPDSTGKTTLAECISLGQVIVLASPQTTTLKIDVDATEATTKLGEATKAAEQLEAALTRVKDMLK